tara:strand:- start:296 stop:1411 length:1116 start_codon:yes stop_codon:yes gene_type:complete
MLKTQNYRSGNEEPTMEETKMIHKDEDIALPDLTDTNPSNPTNPTNPTTDVGESSSPQPIILKIAGGSENVSKRMTQLLKHIENSSGDKKKRGKLIKIVNDQFVEYLRYKLSEILSDLGNIHHSHFDFHECKRRLLLSSLLHHKKMLKESIPFITAMEILGGDKERILEEVTIEWLRGTFPILNHYSGTKKGYFDKHDEKEKILVKPDMFHEQEDGRIPLGPKYQEIIRKYIPEKFISDLNFIIRISIRAHNINFNEQDSSATILKELKDLREYVNTFVKKTPILDVAKFLAEQYKKDFIDSKIRELEMEHKIMKKEQSKREGKQRSTESSTTQSKVVTEQIELLKIREQQENDKREKEERLKRHNQKRNP